ncbi:MAG: DNA-3-methyladenine glycosylase 2 family protein [Chitinophagaceae bacterium]|nr:MAG: DNA-3-methyladenine glycosylase 2 family protein [Chitinophagaceae bacterium]
MTSRFDSGSFTRIVDELTARDRDLKKVVDTYGYPPMWSRDEGFETLVLIILEQQVSLASAFAAFTKLKTYLGTISPEGIMGMTDEELRSCYFSRQKSGYVRDLSRRIIAGDLDLANLSSMDEGEIRSRLKAVKGIGDWTVDVYLMFCLQHPDFFPLGDIALVNSLRTEKGLDKSAGREELRTIAEEWKPWRTIASMILWHAYICRRSMKLPDSYRKAP